MENFNYFSPFSKLNQKLLKFFPESKFNHISIKKGFKSGFTDIQVFRDLEGEYLLNSNGKLKISNFTSQYSVYSNMDYYAFAKYLSDHKHFGVSGKIISEKIMNRTIYCVPKDVFSELQILLSGSNVGFKFSLCHMYDKTPKICTLASMRGSQIYTSTTFSDKGTNMTASLFFNFGLLISGQCITKPFVLNSIEIGYLTKYKILDFYTSLDALHAKANIASIAKVGQNISIASNGQYDHLQKIGNFKFGILIDKDAKLRASIDARGFTDIDVIIKPKPWLKVCLNSKSNIFKAETATFGYSLDFNI